MKTIHYIFLVTLLISQMFASDTPFEKRFVYFDRSLHLDENLIRAKEVIQKAKRLDFNGFVLSQSYLYTRLSHQNENISKTKQNIKAIEEYAHQNGLEFIVMHFSENMPNEVVHDDNPNNKFFQDNRFDFSESTTFTSKYSIINDEAIPNSNPQVVTEKKGQYYHFVNIQAKTEYKITVDLSTNGYKSKYYKISILDEDFKGEHGKIIAGVNKYIKGIKKNLDHGKYYFYFNSLDHPNMNGKIKIYLPKNSHITVNSISIEESPYKSSLNVIQEPRDVIVKSSSNDLNYTKDVDYTWDSEDNLILLSDKIKEESSLDVIWYPIIDTNTIEGQQDSADACANPNLYFQIIEDQFSSISQVVDDKIDAIAFNDDEWREAGWDPKCKDIYSSEFNVTNNSGEFTAGDYIGITSKRTIEQIEQSSQNKIKEFYLMSDMFDPNFNGTNPYMGAKGGAKGAINYLDPTKSIFFNWFPNPYEPGLEFMSSSDFQKSAKYFSDHGFRQIIAGYHDDLKNLKANTKLYKDAPQDVKKSIIGFMFLIWHQPGKHATYDEMDETVAKICQELPQKWSQKGCDAATPKAPSDISFTDITSHSVTIHWKDNSDNEDGFKIFRDGKLIYTTDANITKYTDKNLSSAQQYSYTIKATNN